MLIEDFRDAGRALIKQPRFLAIATLTLALGIGAVTAIFRVVNGVLFKPLPYPHADRLVNVWSTAPGIGYDQFPQSPDLFVFFKRHQTVFDDLALFQTTRVNVTEGGPPEVVDASLATHGYFPTLGVGFAQGRAYTADEDKPESPRVAVVSHRLWTRRYGAEASLVGRSVRINGEPAEVVGIAPRWIDRAGSPDLWIPARFNEASPPAGTFGWNAIGRLKEGISADDASTQLAPLVQRALQELIRADNYRAFLTEGGYRLRVNDMKEDLVGNLREPLWILLGTVAMVLLVACGNVANLCLVRAELRQREFAVRSALGSSRGGLVRKMLAEAFVLSAIGAGLGVLCAAAAVPVLLQLAPDTIPRLDEIRIDGRVLALAAGAAALSALIFGLVPAVRYTRPGMSALLFVTGLVAAYLPARRAAAVSPMEAMRGD